MRGFLNKKPAQPSAEGTAAGQPTATAAEQPTPVIEISSEPEDDLVSDLLATQLLVMVHVFCAVQVALRLPVKPLPQLPPQGSPTAVGFEHVPNIPLIGLVGLLVHSTAHSAVYTQDT